VQDPAFAFVEPHQVPLRFHFGTWFSRHGGVGVMAGLDDLRGLFQPRIL